MNKESLKEYLSSRYQGWSSFLNNVIFPIFGEDVENPLKVAPLIQSNLTPVKFFHSFILFILVFFVFFLSVMPGSTLNFVYKYNDSFLLLHLRSDSPKSSIRIA